MNNAKSTKVHDRAMTRTIFNSYFLTTELLANINLEPFIKYNTGKPVYLMGKFIPSSKNPG